MPLEFEDHKLTGPMDNNGTDGIYKLNHAPITGVNGEWLITVSPVHGPAQKEGIDWGLTGANFDHITYNLSGSTIREIRQHDIGVSGVNSVGPVVRLIYNYE